MVDIIIPTIRTPEELTPQLRCLEENTDMTRYHIVIASSKACEAVNRNAGLDAATSGMVIMIDDDTTGFHDGWADQMIEPLSDPSILMVAARLYAPDGSMAYSMCDQNDLTPGIVEVPSKRAPTACVAFRDDGTRFDERFILSGFDDTWFCECLNRKYPNGRYVINNNVKIIHINEKKGQMEGWEQNSILYNKLLRGEIK